MNNDKMILPITIIYWQYDLYKKQVIGGGMLYRVLFESTGTEGIFENVVQIDLQVQDIPHPSRINIYLYRPGEQKHIGFAAAEIRSDVLTAYIKAKYFKLYEVKG